MSDPAALLLLAWAVVRRISRDLSGRPAALRWRHGQVPVSQH